MPEPQLVRTARPTIVVGGAENAQLAERLLSLLIVEDTGGLYRCEASVGNWGDTGGGLGYLYLDRRTLDFGKTFKIKLGADTLFDGRITGLEAQFPDHRSPVLVILAEDRFQDLRMTRRTRAFSDVSDADIFNRVANDHGLTPSVSVQGPTYKVLSQVNQSDLAFLRERARLIDAEIWMEGSTLNAKSHASRGGTPLRLTYGGSLHEFSVIADLAHQRTSVAVSGWDVAGKSAVKFEAGESAVQGELGNDVSGASVLTQSFGERKEVLAHTVPFSTQEAQSHAESYFRKHARRFVTGRGATQTSAQVRAGAFVELSNLGPIFNGKYYLTEVRHTFDMAHGLRTSFTAERPGLGRP